MELELIFFLNFIIHLKTTITSKNANLNIEMKYKNKEKAKCDTFGISTTSLEFCFLCNVTTNDTDIM